jgi:hypothetical protein
MIEDMAARKLNPHTQRSHIYSCKRFAAWLKRSPDTATPDEVRGFQLYLIESGSSICNRNRIMTGVRFLFRVTLRRHDLAAEVWHLKEPQKLPPVLSPEEVKRVLAMATSLKARAMLTLSYTVSSDEGIAAALRELIACVTITPAEKGPPIIDITGRLAVLTGTDLFPTSRGEIIGSGGPLPSFPPTGLGIIHASS